MSGRTMKQTERIEAPRGPGIGMGGQLGSKAMNFGPSLRRLAAQLRPQRVKVALVIVAAIAAVGAGLLRPTRARSRHRHRLRRGRGRPVPGRHDSNRGHRRSAGGRTGPDRRPALGYRLHAWCRDRLRSPRRRARRGPRPLCRLGPALVPPGMAAQRCGAEHHLPTPFQRRGQAQPAPPRLLRPSASRRAAEPGDQRHRQHRPEPAADHEPAAHLRPHHRLRRGDDVPDLALTRSHRPGDDPGNDGRCRADHEEVPEAVHLTVAFHRGAEWPDRGGLHRSLPGQGVRASGRGRSPFRRGERAALHGELRRPVPLRADHAADDVHREPQLRDHRRRRRAASGQRHHEPR